MIETKAGAAGQVGAQFAAAAKPDGYTLLIHIVSISGFAEVDKLFGRQPKFTRADFIPIARFTEGPMVLIVNDQQPYKTLKELVDDAKKRPDEIIFSSSGLYGALHLPTALFMKAAGIKMKHLPTNGGGPALTALLGNNSQVLVSSIAAASPHIKAGKVRALACFSDKRAASLPDVPTLKELGYDVRVLPVGRPVRAQGHARRRRQRSCARKQRRRPPPSSSPRRSTTSATSWPISTSRTSPSSGTRTPSGSRTRCDRSARSESVAAQRAHEDTRDPAQGPCRRRRVRRRRRARAGCEQRPARSARSPRPGPACCRRSSSSS